MLQAQHISHAYILALYVIAEYVKSYENAGRPCKARTADKREW